MFDISLATDQRLDERLSPPWLVQPEVCRALPIGHV